MTRAELAVSAEDETEEIVGGVVSGVLVVVTDLATDWAEVFPAKSYAKTVTEYAVEADSPDTANDSVVDVPIRTPFLKIL